MFKTVDKLLADGKKSDAIEYCLANRMPLLASWLLKEKIVPSKPIRVKLVCNWTTSEHLAQLWNKMSQGNFRWNNIVLVWTDPVDYYVVINMPNETEGKGIDKKKTILFQMEPHMEQFPSIWKEWSQPPVEDFFHVCRPDQREYNNGEWHLSLTYNQLVNSTFKKDKVLSTVLSGKYSNPGQVLRVDFVKFLEKVGIQIDVYGDNRWDYKDYKGSLPYHQKDQALLPYKYTFNCENHEIPFYYTEKLIDGILSECLTFYWGCPNIRELIDPRAYVQLSLGNFEQDAKTIETAIKEDWHSQRLPFIREAKKKILNELQFFPKLEEILKRKGEK